MGTVVDQISPNHVSVIHELIHHKIRHTEFNLTTIQTSLVLFTMDLNNSALVHILHFNMHYYAVHLAIKMSFFLKFTYLFLLLFTWAA